MGEAGTGGGTNELAIPPPVGTMASIVIVPDNEPVWPTHAVAAITVNSIAELVVGPSPDGGTDFPVLGGEALVSAQQYILGGGLDCTGLVLTYQDATMDPEGCAWTTWSLSQ